MTALGAVLTAAPGFAGDTHGTGHKARSAPGHVFPVDFSARGTSPYTPSSHRSVRLSDAPRPGTPVFNIAVRPGVTPKAAKIYTLGLRVGF